MDFLFASELEAPVKEHDVLVAGKYVSNKYGKFEITTEDIDAMVSEFYDAHARGQRMVGFDHREAAGDTVAAGWIQDVRRDGDRLRAVVQWTPKGTNAIRNKEYRFQSAEYQTKFKSKTTGETVEKPRLKGFTLTNRPFIEGMEPIELSDDSAMAFWPSDEDEATELAAGYGAAPGKPAPTKKSAAGAQDDDPPADPPDSDDLQQQAKAQGVAENKASQIAKKLGIDWSRVTFTIHDLIAGINNELEEHGSGDPETDVIGNDMATAAKIAWAHLKRDPNYYKNPDDVQMAEGNIGGTSIRKLPNSSYAWVDSDGKGHLPYKDSSGKIDLAHTRNALARLNQVQGMPESARSTVRRKLEAALRSAGGNPGSDDNANQRNRKMSDSIRSTLGLADDADDAAVEAAIVALKESTTIKADETVALSDFKLVQAQAAAAERALHEMKRDTLFDRMHAEGKTTPAEREVLVKLYDADPESVTALLAARQPVVQIAPVGSGNNGRKFDIPTTVIATAEDPERRGLSEAIERILSEKPGISYLDAMILAEKGAKV